MPRAGAGSADEPAPDLELARRIPDARPSGREGRGARRGGEEKGRTVRRLFMAAGVARRERSRQAGTGRRGLVWPLRRRRCLKSRGHGGGGVKLEVATGN
jgi:hypothetical protein